MNPNSTPAQATATFEQNRPRLWGLAYRMLGTRAEAEDMVQEAWLRWHRAPQDDIRSPEAWLVTAVTRLCIDRLRQLRSEREAYAGPWLPEPLLDEAAPPADHASELASDLSVAFLALLERMAPEERAALLLREVFDSDYGDIAKILSKTEVACRQLVSRARSRLRDGRPRVHVDAAAQSGLLRQLVVAIQNQDKLKLVSLLASDATWTSDGGGRAKAAKKTIYGADRVARFAAGVFRRYVSLLHFQEITVNDEAGIAVYYEGNILSVITIRTDGKQIFDVYSILNPEKLQELAPLRRH